MGNNSSLIKALQSADPVTAPKAPNLGKRVPVKVVDVLMPMDPKGKQIFKIRIRLAHIDTPENKKKKGITEQHKAAGLRVGEILREKLLNQIVYVEVREPGMYFRLIADIYLKKNSRKSVSDWLLEEGMAKTYEGKTKETWSQSELQAILDR